MPTGLSHGTRRDSRPATRPAWRNAYRPASRPGPRSRRRPDVFAELGAALQALVRFHEAHPDWFPPLERPDPINPELEAALERVYGPKTP